MSEYEWAMWDLECRAEKMACERDISKQEAREIICESFEPDFNEEDLK